MSTLDELTTPATAAEITEKIYEALAARGVSTTAWKSGSVVRTIIAGVAIVLAAFSRLQAAIAKSGFLELAEGDWLTLVALYVYGVARDEGAFASGTVTLTNTGGGVYSGGADDLVFRHATSGKTYRNTGTYSLGAGATLVVPIQATEIGSASTATPGTITAFVTPLIGVTVTNAASVVGRDPATDAELRTLCYEKTGTLSPNGPRDAYAFVARSAVRADGSSIGVTRVRSVPDGLGGVTVYVATATGGVTGSAGDPSTDLGAINAAIQELCAPLAITATVVSAVAEIIAPTYELWVRDTTGMGTAEIEAAVAARLTALMASSPIGGHVIGGVGKIYVTAIETTIGAALEDDLVRVVVTVPAADVTIAINEAPVLGAITVTAIHEVSGGSF
jgi:hypothetical protein